MVVYVDKRICKGCGLCVYFCSRRVLQLGEQRNAKGFNVVEVVRPEECIVCRRCELGCPDFAIYVGDR